MPREIHMDLGNNMTVERLSNGFQLNYRRFSSSDSSSTAAYERSLLGKDEPLTVRDHKSFHFERISDHYLVFQGYANMEGTPYVQIHGEVIILDDLPLEDVRQQCLELCLRKAEELKNSFGVVKMK
ncbi:MAG: hypothetical protein KJ879_03730 [Nanoarchaeota archaeon]|nr:hypothetical protein [Nanoarchaeota archaeon]